MLSKSNNGIEALPSTQSPLKNEYLVIAVKKKTQTDVKGF